MQDSHNHSPCHAGVRAESIKSGSGHQSGPIGIQDVIIKPIVLGHVGKRIFQQLVGKWVPLDPLLPKIESPVLIIWGDKDRVFDVSCADRFEKGLKYSKKVVFENLKYIPNHHLHPMISIFLHQDNP